MLPLEAVPNFSEGRDRATIKAIGEALSAHARLLGLPSLTPSVGERYELQGRTVVPLPHPSGASGWLNDPANRVRLEAAVALVRRELSSRLE